MKQSVFLLSILFLIILGCVETENPPEPFFDFAKGEGYFIINEGGFSKGNSSVSYKYEDIDSIVHDIYATVHNMSPGDVLQSAVLHDQSLFLVLNNSAYLKRLDVHTFEEKAEITGFNSPRYLQIIDENKAFVSDIFAQKLWVLDLNTNEISDSIEIDGWTEEMAVVGDLVYLTSPSSYGGPVSHSVYVVDSNTDELVDTIQVGNNPINIVADDKGWIHVFCQGDPFADPLIKPSLYSINSSNPDEIRQKNIPNLPVAYQSRMRLSPDQETIYLLYGSVYEIDNLESGLSYTSIPLIEADGRSLYGLEINPETGNIFVSDAKDYNQIGTFYEYKTNAIELGNFDTGIIPTSIIWY